MTRRFDRTPGGRKLHMQSLGALRHFDYNDPAAYSYEQALMTVRALDIGMEAIAEQFRRAVFNVAARNQDDHVKNIAFLMDRDGSWSLSPAFDVTYAWNSGHRWLDRHQMSINGKRADFDRDDLLQLASVGGLRTVPARRILDEVMAAVARWREFADAAGLDGETTERIARAHRTLV